MSIKIELISNALSQKAAQLILPIQQLEFGVAITLEDQPDLLDLDKFYLQPGGGFWGAFRDDELVGTIGLLNVGHATGVIRKMFVKKEFRGKEPGVAQKLIDNLITVSKPKGIKDLYLGTIEKMKAAHRFYERNGFKKISESQLPPWFPRMIQDNTFYHLSLPK